MARYNVSFARKVSREINDNIEEAINSLGLVSACAGIRDNPSAAFKARVNHHGAPATRVPARRFVYDATRNIGDHKFGSEIREIIKDALRNPQIRTRRTYKTRTSQGEEITVSEDTRRDKPFGSADYSRPGTLVQRTPQRIMNRIAQQMAANQRKAIRARAYSGVDSNGNDPAINQPRVVQRKGFNWPMVDSGETLAAIEGWTE